MRGKVKWFNDVKGFGFITGEDGKDYFVHYKNILGEGRKTLYAGNEVAFDECENDKGLYAGNVSACIEE